MQKLLLLLVVMLLASQLSAQQCVIDPPSNLFVTNVSSCSATLNWSSTSGAIKYFVRYRLSPSGAWSARVSAGTDTFYTFQGLLPGKTYDLSVSAKCADGSKSAYKKKKATTSLCTLPVASEVQTVNGNSVNITVTLNCPSDTIRYRYQPVGGTWVTSYVVNTNLISITGLIPGAVYEYQLTTCPLNQSNWTAIKTFTLNQPNFLLVVLDDSRYDSYGCNGGPSWFPTPNIDRIANEGINFKNNFVVYSFCSPSRGTIVTGLYPHHNGAIDNTHTVFPYLPNLATILDDAGYNTGMIGKFTVNQPQAGYDYWLSAMPEYVNGKYNYNGTKKTIPGHNTDVLTDSALAFMARSEEPFYLWVGYHAPHDSAIAQPQFQGIYEDEPMPVPDNTAPYSVNYPSFLDHLAYILYLPPDQIPPSYQRYFETLAGVDEAMGKLIAQLESMDELDNTMIIFMSDNGSLFGEHGLSQKRFAYDPSIRVPLFVRYPSWFNGGTILTSQMSLNIDIAPTIVEAAGLLDTFDFDGHSLKKLADQTVQRSDMLYESLGVSDISNNLFPFIRAVRSLHYKYIYYGCNSDTVEEFFDLVSDPEENINLINNSSYNELVQQYRERMITLQETFDDTLVEEDIECYIENPQQKLSGDETIFRHLTVYPNPSEGILWINNGGVNGMLDVLDPVGKLVAKINLLQSENMLDLRFLPKGIYFLDYKSGEFKQTEKIVIE
jgi:N-acetylglucosamine-6-sulfatase